MAIGAKTNALDGGDFRGKTRSFTVLPGRKSWSECEVCGASLYGRREREYERTIDGQRMKVEVFRCPGGHGNEVRRPIVGRKAA